MSTSAKNDLMALLTLLKSKAESSDLEPKIGMQRVIELMRSQGHPFNYAIFTQLAADPAIDALIANFNKDQLTIDAENLKSEQPEKQQAADSEEEPTQPDVVNKMAKRALSRHR